VERDYTPVSSDAEWKNGCCSLAVKIYSSGAATQWLRTLQAGAQVLLSHPHMTLRVPSFAPEGAPGSLMRPSSVLLLVGGTGVAPAIQAIRMSTGDSFPLICSYSCRQNDVLGRDMLVKVMEGRIKYITSIQDAYGQNMSSLVEKGAVLNFHVTPPNTDEAPIFQLQSPLDGTIEAPHSLDGNSWEKPPWVKVSAGRVTQQDVEISLGALKKPTRVVISGPASFNSNLRELVCSCGVTPQWITVLEA
jgi:hypothetical protein